MLAFLKSAGRDQHLALLIVEFVLLVNYFMLDFLKSAGRDQHLALLMVEFAFHLMQLLDNINKDTIL
jgi:hypothetical protein